MSWAAIAVFSSACLDHAIPVTQNDPPAADTPSRHFSALLACTASVSAGSVTCAAPAPAGGGNQALIVGGQGRYVQLAASDVVVGEAAFTFNTTIQNLIVQALGTVDGVTPHPDGIRIFFEELPTVTAGSGSISVANADGVETYTQADQPYYQYDGILLNGETSAPREWQFSMDPTVDAFHFSVYVVSEVQYTGEWIAIDSAPANLFTDGLAELTAVVRDEVGNILPTAVTWMSSDTTIATVSEAGVVNALDAGLVTITASAGAATAEASIGVCPALNVGDHIVITGANAAYACFGATDASAEFTYIPINLSASSLSLTTTGTGIQAVTGPPTPALLPSSGGGLFDRSAVTESTNHVAERNADRRALAGLVSTPASRIRRPTGPAGGPSYTIVPGVPSVGDLWSLNVARSCNGAPDIRTARVRTITPSAVIVADTLNPPGGFTTAQYDSIGIEYDTIAAPVLTANFGTPTDVDSNGRVVIFFTRAVNELSPPASSQYEMGYFENRDLFSSASCERSNEGEIIYMMTPDPTGSVNSNVRTVSLVRGNAVRTLAHETQHLINASRRIYITDSPLEESWLDEGLSRIAEELLFYRTSFGLEPRSNIVVSDLTIGPNAGRRVTAYNTYANTNIGYLRGWLQRPDTTSAFQTTTSLSAQGALWAFLRYSADRSGGSEQAFWTSLVDGGLTGRANLQAAFGGDAPNDWLRDFTAAMYADDAVAGVPAILTNPSWSFRSLFATLNGSYQLVPRPLTNGIPLTLSYRASGGAIYGRFGVAAGNFATITSTTGGTPPSDPFQLIVMRSR